MKRREREKEILAEMEKATKESGMPQAQEEQTQEVRHCRRCKSAMEKGKCPVCGYKEYQPMAEGERKKIKGILTVVCLAVFLLLFLWIKG